MCIYVGKHASCICVLISKFMHADMHEYVAV